MGTYFDKKLIELLPPLYEREDESGDLQTFLTVPSVTLDEIKELIDRFPELFDVEQCDERFLPYLARIVGWSFDPTRDSATQRRAIREAVEFYRRKGTIPAIRRSLTDIGWEGNIEETFRQALRLNRRSVMNHARLPGLIYSLGVYRIEQDNVIQDIRDALEPHHPAGTRVFFLQWLYSVLSMETDFEAFIKKVAQRVCLGHLHETFVVNHNSLNTDYHLTRKNKTWGWWQITSGTTLLQDVERAGTCISRWHARDQRFRLNSVPLNTEKFPNLWVSERKLAICCDVDTRREIETGVPYIRFAGENLNRSRLNQSGVPCRIKFRQKDMLSESSISPAVIIADGRVHQYGKRSRLSHWFRVNHSPLGGMDKVSGASVGRHAFLIAFAGALWSEVREAYDVVDRWRARRPGFNLNNQALNLGELTDAYVTEARASFELKVDTGYPRRRRVETLVLNNRRINHAGLRLSVDRTRPMRLGLMPLNNSGFRVLEKSLHWRFRQKDEHAYLEPPMEAWSEHQVLN